jgi:hypothetical protein
VSKKEQVVTRKIMWPIAVLLMLTGGAYAQDDKNNEIGFLLGRIATPSRTAAAASSSIEIGGGTSLQATYARRIYKGEDASLYLEFPFVATPLQDINAGPPGTTANYASLFVAPGLRVKLAPDRLLAPWFSIGGGYANFEESPTVLGGLPGRASAETHTHSGVLQIGGGVDVQPGLTLLLPISFRGEVRDFYTAAPNYNVRLTGTRQHNLVFSGGFVIHF